MEKTLPQISPEQLAILDNLRSGNNVVVDSVAGSGKTTTNLHIANAMPHQRILLLTYNAKLKIETRERVFKGNMTNLEVHSYHSCAVKYYDRRCFDDKVLECVLEGNYRPFSTIRFDTIIVDEAQDVHPLLYRLLCKLFKDNLVPNAQICIMGDQFQSIFQHNYADERYVSMAEKVFAWNEYPWVACKLSNSFRITFEMANFINYCMLPTPRIFSKKSNGIKPKYYHGNAYGMKPFEAIEKYLKMGYKPDDIFVLAYSVKRANSPVCALENKIKKKGEHIPVYAPMSDQEVLDPEVLKGKLVISSFHQSKGLERKVVLAFNFDTSYFRYYAKDANRYKCPNLLYVVTTRASEHLCVFHHWTEDFMPFLNKDLLPIYCDVRVDKDIESVTITREDVSDKERQTSPTDLVKHVPQQILSKCFQLLKRTVIRPPGELIEIATKTAQRGGYETVSEITGTAIPAYFEWKTHGKLDILENLRVVNFDEVVLSYVEKERKQPLKRLSSINLQTLTTSELLYISNCWSSWKVQYLFKVFQIDRYDWVTEEQLQQCLHRMNRSLKLQDPSFEQEICTDKQPELLQGMQLVGYIDCVDGNRLYEFKCVHTLSVEHHLQLAIYMYQNEKRRVRLGIREKYRYFLYNILTDETIELESTLRNLSTLVDILVQSKYGSKRILLDEEFIAHALRQRAYQLSLEESVPSLEELEVPLVGSDAEEEEEEVLEEEIEEVPVEEIEEDSLSAILPLVSLVPPM